MKKCILLNLLLILISVLPLNAQTSHLTFKDIPIDGKLNLFIEKMETKGFSLIKQANDYAIMEGEFANKACDIYIVATPKTQQVWKVAVNLPEDKSWYSLKNDYLDYVKQFQTKYGRPTKNYDFFSNPYYEGDGYEMQALENEKCHYLSVFERPNGLITVEISSTAAIRFSYEDAINVKIVASERNSKLQDDI